MDWELCPCLRALWHVNRRGLDWFQQRRSFRLGYSCVLVPLVHRHSMSGWQAQTYYLMNKMDHDLPSCLRVLRHVYRRGLDWFQQHWSYIDCFPPPEVQSTVKHAWWHWDGIWCCQSLESNASTLFSWGHISAITRRSGTFCPRLQTTYIDCFPPPGKLSTKKHVQLHWEGRLVLSFRGINSNHFHLLAAHLYDSYNYKVHMTVKCRQRLLLKVFHHLEDQVQNASVRLHCEIRLVLAFRGIKSNHFALWAGHLYDSYKVHKMVECIQRPILTVVLYWQQVHSASTMARVKRSQHDEFKI